MSSLVSIEDLTVRYGRAVGVSGLNLAISSGEAVGLLGANGAGKSSTVRALLGMVKPATGKVSLFGMAPGSVAAVLRPSNAAN
ncbi:ATP-binding cassette domain-containing protein, partial [bacterium]|nr:ATP-binding cassette domain-containing protein [bacterium]